MLLMVLLLPLNSLGRMSNTGRKIALANIILLNLPALNKLETSRGLPSIYLKPKVSSGSLLLRVVIQR